MPSRLFAAFFAFSLTFSAQSAEQTILRVLSDRTPAHLEPLFEHYGQTRGVKVEAVFVKQGLIGRLQARPTEPDLVITSTGDVLEEAKRAGLLRPFSSPVIEQSLAGHFLDPDRSYLTMTYRPRAIFASRERVEPGSVSEYADLSDPKWRGRVCIRSGYHDYNLSLFSQIAVDRGEDYLRGFLTGLAQNLARKPTGNDRAQVRGIYEGVCDLAVANSYYMPIMLANPEQRPWGEASYVIFPDQARGGAYVMRGAAALTRAERNVEQATQLLEYLVSEEGQSFVANRTFEYPVNDRVEMPAATKELGGEQPGIVGGRFEAKFIPLDAIGESRPAVMRVLDEIDFDGKR